MKFFEYLNIYYDRQSLIDFSNNLEWEEVRRKDNNKIIPNLKAYRYKPELFNCVEIKRLAQIFNIGTNKVQLVKFGPGFNYPPHVDFERQTCVLFPVLPLTKYEPLKFHVGNKDYTLYYYGPTAVNTSLKHSIEGNEYDRINLQFDLDCNLEECVKYVTSYNNTL